MTKPTTYQEELDLKKKVNFNNMTLKNFQEEDPKRQMARLIVLSRKRVNLLERIKNNIVFFFWITIISIVLALVSTVL